MKLLTLTAVSLLLIGLTMSGTAYSQVPQIERDALIALYNSTGGANWTTNTGWLGDVGTECDWYGVTCTGINVTGLNLASNNLVGTIPSEIGNFTTITSLNLSNNQLSGSVPAELGNFTTIASLNLGGNQLSGSVPAELGNLTSLTHLKLYSNQLSGSVPAELGNLTSLEILYLDYNQLTGAIPSELGNLTSLSRLYLNNNQLTGSIPPELPHAQFLWLHNNQLTGAIPTELQGSYKQLKLNNNQLSGSIPPGIKKMSASAFIEVSNNPKLDRNVLIKLYDSTNGISWTNKTGWAGDAGTECDWYGVTCTGINVTGLNLASNNLVGTIPSEIGNFTTITSLNLSSNTLTGSIPTELGNLSNLTILNLSTNSLTGPLPQWLSDMAISTLNVTDAFTSAPVVAISGGNRTIEDSDGVAGESVSFTGTASDSDGTIATTQWLVDGSEVATGLSATISLPNGSTVVTFKATDNDSASATTTVTITITAPAYTATDEWPSPYNGVTPDSSLGLAFNNIGVFSASDSIIYTCLRIFTDGLPGSAGGISEFDIGLTVVSLDEATVQITKYREFNTIGALNENVELPDCSGKFETTTSVYTDIIEVGDSVLDTTWSLIDPTNLILKLSSYQELTAN